MLKIILLGIFTFALLSATAQIQTQVIGDSVFMHSNTGKSELILQNSTDTVNGFLFNNGAGRTAFKRALVKINDSLYLIGADTLHIHNTDAGMTNGWSLTGNSATTPGTNFIGTTDNTALLFKVNNVQSGTINDSIKSTSFGYNTLPVNTGNYNSGFGFEALAANTTGYNNTAVGGLALYANTGGYDNTTLGVASLFTNSTGFGNSAFGRDALRNNTTGNYNMGIGQQALTNNSIGISNTAIGRQSLYYNTTGNYNIGIGNAAGINGNPGSSNTFYISDSSYHMYYALDSSSGAAPSVIGKDPNGFWHVYQTPIGGGGISQVQLDDSTAAAKAFSWNLTGNSSTTSSNFIGTTDNLPLLLKVNNTSAGYLGTSTNYNTSFGILSLPSSATGAKNTALGASTLSLNTTGNDNVASGYAALKSNTSGYRNAAIGYESMYQNISGYNNVAIGNISQSWDTASIGNTSVGSESMNQAGGGVHNGGSYNSAFGYGALGDNWNNKYNIGIGYLAGEGSTSSNTLYIADSTFHMKFKLDSASGAAPSVIGKDANGFWHVYSTPAGSGGSGGGTVTNLATGYGLTGGPITTSGTILVDTTALHQKFVGFEDSTVYYPYNSNPKGYLTSSNAWSPTGNAGTTSSNFLGTTDNMALQFKVNNIFSGFISTSPSFSSTAFGNSALSTYSTGALTGNPNTAFGSGALTKVTSGSFNTAVGHSAGGSFTTGYYNTSIGNLANDWNQTGINNTSVGEESMGQAGSGVHNHSYNTAIGFAALADNYGNYNIGLGNRAGQNVAGDSTLFVSDSTIHMKFHLDSIAGIAANVIGKDANGFWHVYQPPSGSGSAGISTVQEDGTSLTARPTLNFNYGVTATDNAASSTTAVDINLSTASNSLTTDVSMSSGSTFYDGGTVSLPAGTWLITATATIESSNNSAMKITGKIWDGTTVYSASEGSVGSLGGGAKGYVNISMNSLVTVSSTTTIKGSYASTIASCSLKAATADNNTGTSGKTTLITAVRIK